MMMGQGSYMAPAGGNPAVTVVGQQFMAPYPVDLTMARWTLTAISHSNYGVTDANGNIMFKVKVKSHNLRNRHIMLDAAGNPILSIQRMCMRSIWKVYRGVSSDSTDLLFTTVRRSSIFKFKTQSDVFLASNTSKDDCDFKIKGSWFQRKGTIYAENSSTVIAQMQKENSFSSFVLRKDKFAVTVYPHVDHAFIVALVVILEELNKGF